MIAVRIEPAGVEVTLAPGERLLDLLDSTQHAATALPTSCRAANCATCLVSVLEGGTNLAPPTQRERMTLGEIYATADQRLGCQLHAARDASGTVVLRVITP